MDSQDTPKSSPNHLIRIDPPLLNSANPWATSQLDLQALYDCPYTGAVTIRTSLWQAFKQHSATHQYTFFSSSRAHATAGINVDLPEGRGEVLPGETSSLNTLGYSPIALQEYVEMLVRMSRNGDLSKGDRAKRKPFIVSVTGTADEVGRMYEYLVKVLNVPDEVFPPTDSTEKSEDLDLMMEINLSCPNILDKPPPAYDSASLKEYIVAVAENKRGVSPDFKPINVGIKTPPYTYHGQFQTLIDVLEDSMSLDGRCPISFITATNTLGSCLVLNAANEPALGSVNGTGIGGLAGDALHPIALGNVKTIRGMLDASTHEAIRNIAVIGIGGVGDAAGFKRMKSVGADAVGVGTALGREGVTVFEKISSGLSSADLR